jgi:hypothetical protein
MPIQFGNSGNPLLTLSALEIYTGAIRNEFVMEHIVISVEISCTPDAIVVRGIFPLATAA